MSMQAINILNRAAIIIQDATNVRWPETELLGWLNDGQREIALFRPDASVVNGSITLTANSTKQAIPSGGIRLMDITRNMGSDGNTPGNAIRIIQREILDSQNPGWHSQTGSTTIQHFIFDARDPLHFYVFPRPPATPAVQVEAIYAAAPADCTYDPSSNPTATINIADIYGNALLDYVLYRAYAKDSQFAGNADRSAKHYAAFSGSLTGSAKVNIETSPQAFSPLNPNVATHGAPA